MKGLPGGTASLSSSRGIVWVQRHTWAPGTSMVPCSSPAACHSSTTCNGLLTPSTPYVRHNPWSLRDSLASIQKSGGMSAWNSTECGTAKVSKVPNCASISTVSTECHPTPCSVYRSIRTASVTTEASCDSDAPSNIESLDEVQTSTCRDRAAVSSMDSSQEACTQLKAAQIENRLLKTQLKTANAQLKHQQSMVVHLMKQLDKERERRCNIEDEMLALDPS